jgi:hypothetical protein
MKTMLVTAAALAMMSGAAFAQGGTGPTPQSDTMNKPGNTSGSMNNGTMDKGAATNGTTGMSNGTTSDGMAKDNMKKDTSSDSMKKNGTSK